MTTHGIIAEKLTKIYTHRKRQGWFRSIDEEKLAVDHLDLEVQPGKVIGLLGLNGAGKTTTIKMLSTLLLPTSGKVRVDELDLVRDAQVVRQRINMIAGGERMIYWRLTARENLWYFAQLYDVDSRELDRRITGLLEMVGLGEAADIPVERFSKGMKQRLQIARGLINDPTYLFLDEPTLGLDAPIARDVRQMVRRMAEQGKGVLLTSHYLAEVEELCSYIYIIDRGRLVVTGSPLEVKNRTHPDRVVRVLLPVLPPSVAAVFQDIAMDTGARLEQEYTEDHVVVTVRHPADITGQVVAAVALNGGSILKLEVVEPTLEDAVLALTKTGEWKEATEYATA